MPPPTLRVCNLTDSCRLPADQPGLLSYKGSDVIAILNGFFEVWGYEAGLFDRAFFTVLKIGLVFGVEIAFARVPGRFTVANPISHDRFVFIYSLNMI